MSFNLKEMSLASTKRVSSILYGDHKSIKESAMDPQEMQQLMDALFERLIKELPNKGDAAYEETRKVAEKVDKLHDSMLKLLVLEERQQTVSNRLDLIEHQVADINKDINNIGMKVDRLYAFESRADEMAKDINGLGTKVEKYVNLGKGVLVAISTAWAIFVAMAGFFLWK
jgi:hypothetical protein